mmetsp:Transcript_124327/g.310827  ORF Transcript_124327/g.310827 Transcript_124327/m.310827 type:complete len:280 (+) Transcript_124327:6262-7101(+)
MVSPEVLPGELDHIDNVIPVGQGHHARLPQLELEDFLLALRLGHGTIPCNLLTLVVASMQLRPGLLQERAELDAAQPRPGLTQRLLVLEHQLIGQARKLEAVLNQGLLEIFGKLLACEGRLRPRGPTHFPCGAPEHREDGGLERGLHGRGSKYHLQAISAQREDGKELLELHPTEDDLGATVRNQLVHGPCDDALQQHLVPALVQRWFAFQLLWERERFARREQGKPAVDPSRAVCLEGRREAHADPSATVLLIKGLHPNSARAVRVECDAKGPLELLL